LRVIAFATVPGGTVWADGRLHGPALRALVFMKDDGTGSLRLYRVDAGLTADPPVLAQVSTLGVPVGALCGFSVEPDLSDPLQSKAIVTSGGVDGDCATAADNTFYVVPIHALASEPPLVAPDPLVTLVRPVYASSGAIAGWLAMHGGATPTASLDPPELGSGTALPDLALIDGVGPPKVLANVPGALWVESGGHLKVLVPGATALADPGGVPTTTDAWEFGNAVTLDERHLYLVDSDGSGAFPGGVLRRVRLDGSEEAERIGGFPRPLWHLAAGAERLVAVDEGGAVYSVPKSGGTCTTIYQPPGPAPFGETWATPVGTTVLVSDGTFGIARAIADDGSSWVEYGSSTAPSQWLVSGGAPYPAGGLPAQGATSVILARGNGGGFTVEAYDLRARRPGDVLGEIPEPGAWLGALAEASGSATLVSAFTRTERRGLYLVDTRAARSVRPLPSPPGTTQSYVGSDGCSSTGASAPALGAIVAWFALRRRR